MTRLFDDSQMGYPKHRRKGNTKGNTRNGSSQKTLKGEQGHVDIEVLRDRQGPFEPQLVKKAKRGWRASMTKSSACMRAA
jgi:putative transposase